MKLIHTADWHLGSDPKQQLKARESLDQIVKYCNEVEIDGIIIAGDLWDSIQSFGNDTGIKIALEYLRILSDLVKFIFIIKGNSAHDARESIKLLDHLEQNIFTIENNVALGFKIFNGITATDLFKEKSQGPIDLLIHGISYPTKANLLIGTEIDQQNFNFIEIFSRLLGLHGDISGRYPEVPKLTVFHGNVSGCKLSSGQTLVGQDIIIPSYELEKTRSNYYALGHIHLPQNISPIMRYSGSLYNKDFGEIEQKYFGLIEFNGVECSVTNIPLRSSRPMIIIDAEFKGGHFHYNKTIPHGAEIKLRCSVNEAERILITSSDLDKLKSELGSDLKIEFDVTPTVRSSRNEKIMQSKTLLEEIHEYANVIGEMVPDGINEKIKDLEFI
ncbi:MAG: metallophosphoesterase [Ignavibacteriales bacterium]|nr:metallophosphoesterase [Ignavibacteriales bacterium]